MLDNFKLRVTILYFLLPILARSSKCRVGKAEDKTKEERGGHDCGVAAGGEGGLYGSSRGYRWQAHLV